MVWSIVYSSLAEFFMRLIAGSVCALVDLHARTSVKYVFCKTFTVTPMYISLTCDTYLQSQIYERFIRGGGEPTDRQKGSYADVVFST